MSRYDQRRNHPRISFDVGRVSRADPADQEEQGNHRREQDGKDAYGYWIPLPEQPEYILHFSVGITMEYEEAKNVTITKDIVNN